MKAAGDECWPVSVEQDASSDPGTKSVNQQNPLELSSVILEVISVILLSFIFIISSSVVFFL